jgi:hypothetical protein
MDINLPIYGYYPKDGTKFIDPLYAPYQTQKIPIDDEGCYAQKSPWKSVGNPNYVNNDHYRMDWNMDFKRLYPNDPCPAGTSEPVAGSGSGMCVSTRQEAHDSTFYSQNMYRVHNQYFDGYSVSNDKECWKTKPINRKMDPTFKAASFNPFIGDYVIYHEPKTNINSTKYNNLPSRHSYLGF